MKVGSRLEFLGLILLSFSGRIALAIEPGSATAGPTLSNDPLLQDFVQEALENRPELAQVRATIRADLERVPQVRSLPDPVLSLGIQNDGFRAIQIGEMESSWLAIMVSQTFPWYGKRDLRGEVTTLAARQVEADLKRAQLSIQAEVERAYIDLLLARDQLGLLAKLETLWMQAEGMVRSRYESGDSSQSELFRTQLERSRLKQRRFAVEAEERRRVAVLNRLRGHPQGDAIVTGHSLVDLPDPVLPDVAAALEEAQANSPELQKSHEAIEQAGKLVDLAKKDYFPDLTVSAGVMPRWGKFDPMWQVGLSFSIPIWGASKQSHAAEENRVRGKASQYAATATRQLLSQRVTERLTILKALIEVNRLYRSGLLVQSEATISSTMAQYQVGHVSFASVLEALTGHVADINAFYESLAAAQRVEIAQREISLDPATSLSTGGMISSSVPGAGGMNGSPFLGGTEPSSLPAGAAGSGSMSRM